MWNNLEKQDKHLAAVWKRVFLTVLSIEKVYMKQNESLTELLGLSAYI